VRNKGIRFGEEMATLCYKPSRRKHFLRTDSIMEEPFKEQTPSWKSPFDDYHDQSWQPESMSQQEAPIFPINLVNPSVLTAVVKAGFCPT
jgi:hypothetical protein